MKASQQRAFSGDFTSRALSRWLFDVLRGAGALALPAALMLPTLPLVAAAAEPAGGNAESAVKFVQAPEGARVFTIALSATDSSGGRTQGYLAQRSPESVTETDSLPPAIKDTYAGKEFTAFDIAKLPDGTRYLVVLNEDKDIKFLTRDESRMLYARFYRVGADANAKPELLKEGFQSPGNDVSVPVELQLPGIGATKLTKFRTSIGYSVSGFNNGRPQVYAGHGAAMQVAGSEMTGQGKLTLTVTVPEEMKVTGDTQVSLRFEPVTPGLPERTAMGKVTDFLTLGAARFVVTGMAADFSQATIAVVAGSLEETLKLQLQLGVQMPAFSQVDLVTRKSVTREELLEKAKGGAPVLFVFGDFPAPRSGYGPAYPGGQTMFLPIPVEEIAGQLTLELKPKPLVVFVTRQIGIDFLYGDLRSKTPEYSVLADFTDPTRTTFRSAQMNPGGWYGPSYMGGREPSLRQLFNLPERTLSIAAFDSKGKVIYVKADAGSEFLPSIAEAREACKRKQ